MCTYRTDIKEKVLSPMIKQDGNPLSWQVVIEVLWLEQFIGSFLSMNEEPIQILLQLIYHHR